MVKIKANCPSCGKSNAVTSIRAIVDAGTTTSSGSTRIYSSESGSMVGRAESYYRDVSGLASRFRYSMPEAKVDTRWIYYSAASGFLFASILVAVRGPSKGDFGIGVLLVAFMGGLLAALFGILAWGLVNFSAAIRFGRSRETLLKIYDAQREVQRGAYCSRCDVAFLNASNLFGTPEAVMQEVLSLHWDDDDLTRLAKNRISW
jgi:hypothetical protein